MIDREFDHIIGMGGHCQTAFQIRRYFDLDRAYPFDWWVTPTIGLVELLETGFEDIFREDYIKIVQETTGPAVTCSRYHLMHYHDFDEAKINDAFSPYLVRQLCERNNSKFAYLITRLLNLSGDVLFIRHANGWTEFDDRVCQFDPSLIQRFQVAINKLLPNVNVTLLILNDFNSEQGLDGQYTDWLYTSVVDAHGETGWSGSDKGWDDLFNHHKIRLRKPIAIEEPKADRLVAANTHGVALALKTA